MRSCVVSSVVLSVCVVVSLALPAFAQELRSGEPLEFVIRPDDPVVPEHGVGRTIIYTAKKLGRIYVHALSVELDLWLRIENAEGKVLAEDEDSGGGTTPHVEVHVNEGQAVRIVVANSEKSLSHERKGDGEGLFRTGRSRALGQITLKLFEARETEETLAAAKRAEVIANRAKRLERRGDREGARRYNRILCSGV